MDIPGKVPIADPSPPEAISDFALGQLPAILYVPDVARILKCSDERVMVETRRRALPFVRAGREAIYPREALLKVLNERALESMKAEPPSANGAARGATKKGRRTPIPDLGFARKP